MKPILAKVAGVSSNISKCVYLLMSKWMNKKNVNIFIATQLNVMIQNGGKFIHSCFVECHDYSFHILNNHHRVCVLLRYQSYHNDSLPTPNFDLKKKNLNILSLFYGNEALPRKIKHASKIMGHFRH